MVRKEDSFLTWPFINLLLANAMLRVTSFMHIAIVPLYVLSIGASDFIAGLTVTVFTLAALLLRPLAGRIVDRGSRYLTVLLGTALYAAAAAVFALDLSIWLFLCARMVQGAGFSLASTGSSTMATDILPPRRMTAGLGILGLETSLPQALGPLLAIWIVQQYGFAQAFLVATIFVAVSFVLRIVRHTSWRRMDSDRVRQRAEEVASVSDAGVVTPVVSTRTATLSRFVAPTALGPAAVMFLLMFCVAAVNAFLAAYALDRGVPEVGLFFTAMGVFIALSRIVVGRIHARFGEAWVVGTGLVSIAVALVMLVWVDGVTILLVAGALTGWGVGVVQPIMVSRAVLATDPRTRGMANSTMLLAIDGSMTVGGVLFGVISTLFGMGWVFPGAAILVTGGLLVYLTRVRQTT